MGAPVTKMQDSIDAHHHASFEWLTIFEDRSPHVSHGTKPLARRAQGRSFATTSFREPTSQHSTIVLQLSLHSSAAAWAAWKLTRILQSWGRGHRQSAVCTQVVRLLEVCTATLLDALFSDAWQERSCEVHVGRQSESDIVCGALRCLWERGGVQVGWRVI